MIEDVRLIRERIKQAQDCQKRYSEHKRRNLEFSVGNKVFIRVAPYKYVMRVDRKGKLAPRFVNHLRCLSV